MLIRSLRLRESLVGPLGPVSITSIHPISSADSDYDSANDDPARTFVVDFTPQSLTGSYLLTLPDTIEDASDIALDSNEDAGLNMLRDESATTVTPPAFTSSGTQTITKFNATDGIIDSPITVPLTETVSGVTYNSGLIKGISLTLNMSFLHANELSAVLISPEGQAIQLFGNLTSTGKLVAGDDIVLTDLSSQQITKGAAPYDGSYSPQQPLVSTLLNTSDAGTWIHLQIKDNGADILAGAVIGIGGGEMDQPAARYPPRF